jgi:large subunit ribosomal protein L37Ae
MVKKSLGSAKRFGPRYGKTVKSKVARIEKEQRKLHKCPYCSYVRVKRMAAGIWECRKCGAKFTGRAYSPDKRKLQTVSGEETQLVDNNLLLDESEVLEKPKKKVEKDEDLEDEEEPEKTEEASEEEETPEQEDEENQENGQV